MMRRARVRTSSAMTLAELLIASALVGIVMAGALSADFAIRRWQSRIEQRTRVQMDLSRAMEHIVWDAMSAVGFGVGTALNGAAPDGFYFRTAAPQEIGFRIDPDVSAAGDEFYVRYVYHPASQFLQRYQYLATNTTTPTQSDLQFFPLTDGSFVTAQLAADGVRVESVEILLTTRPDPSQTEHALSNPSYRLRTRFFPPGVSQ